jgi:hypothetical protein
MRQEKSPQYWFCDAMETEQQITAAAILRRQPLSSVPDIPPATFLLDHTAAAANISDAIQRRFAQSPDAGVLKRLANVVLEPPNPFNPNARRRPKQGAVILAALIFAALGLAFYFNITAVAR